MIQDYFILCIYAKIDKWLLICDYRFKHKSEIMANTTHTVTMSLNNYIDDIDRPYNPTDVEFNFYSLQDTNLFVLIHCRACLGLRGCATVTQ